MLIECLAVEFAALMCAVPPESASAPDAAAITVLVSGIAASGWHDYFDTFNAAGPGVDLNGHLTQLAAL